MITIQLTEEEWNLAYQIAVERHSKPGSKKIVKNKSDIEIGFIGALGEVAFSKHTGFAIDRSINVGGDAGYDFVNSDGKTLEVKVRRNDEFLYPDLLVDPDKANKADYFVLAYVNRMGMELHQVTLVGWCTAIQVVNGVKGNIGNNRRYIIEAKHLNKITKRPRAMTK